jgi:hypothetical protein
MGLGQRAHNALVSGVIGGGTAELVGGEFQQGFLTAAVARAANDDHAFLSKDEVLAELREHKAFLELEATAIERWGELKYKFGFDIGGSSALRGDITIDWADTARLYPVNYGELDQSKYVDESASESVYWEQLDAFENMRANMSIQRIVAHELTHSAFTNFNALGLDLKPYHSEIISKTNAFMLEHYGELPRTPDNINLYGE